MNLRLASQSLNQACFANASRPDYHQPDSSTGRRTFFEGSPERVLINIDTVCGNEQQENALPFIG